MAEFLQFLFSGITVGAIYALVALGQDGHAEAPDLPREQQQAQGRGRDGHGEGPVTEVFHAEGRRHDAGCS